CGTERTGWDNRAVCRVVQFRRGHGVSQAGAAHNQNSAVLQYGYGVTAASRLEIMGSTREGISGWVIDLYVCKRSGPVSSASCKQYPSILEERRRVLAPWARHVCRAAEPAGRRIKHLGVADRRSGFGDSPRNQDRSVLEEGGGMARHGHRQGRWHLSIQACGRSKELGCGHGTAARIVPADDEHRAVRQHSGRVADSRLVEIARQRPGPRLPAPEGRSHDDTHYDPSRTSHDEEQGKLFHIFPLVFTGHGRLLPRRPVPIAVGLTAGTLQENEVSHKKKP